MSVRGTRVRVVVATAVALALSALAWIAPGTAAPAGNGGVYIALGDSYTSAPLVLNQYGDPIDCGRSDHNYPSLVAAEFKPETFIDVSCGSAETEHMLEPQDGLPAGGTNPPQFNALRADATLVTVGIGGNDAGLVGVATQCAQLGVTQPFGTACRDFFAPGGNDSVAARIEEARPKVAAVLDGIHERSPDARVAIVGYPDVLPDPDEGGCYPLVPLSDDDVRYVDELLIRINRMIAEVAAEHDADFVDTYADSGGHDVCKLPPNRWFEGLVPTEPAYPLHPNGKGEASMARSAIAVLSRPSARAPLLSELRVKPRRVRVGRSAKVRFTLDRAARVSVVYKSRGRGSRGRLGVLPVDGEAGRNRAKIKPRFLGRRAARFRIAATATTNGLSSAPVNSRFRVVPRRR